MVHVLTSRVIFGSRSIGKFYGGSETIGNFGVIVFGRCSFFSFSAVRVFFLVLRVKGLQVGESGDFHGLRRVDRYISGAVIAGRRVPTDSHFGPTIAVATRRCNYS